MKINKCNNTSVGIFVLKGNKILLINRKIFPLGYAIPAGHVENNETYLQGAIRETKEEVGIDINTLKLIHHKKYTNPCSRGAKFHRWKIYITKTNQKVITSKSEVKSFKWVTISEFKKIRMQNKVADVVPDFYKILKDYK